MSISVKDIAFTAGILEGEGTFCLNNNSPRLAVAMTDLDVVECVRNIIDKTKIISPYIAKDCVDGFERKPRYTFTLVGDLAIQWMMTVYSLMGLRRKSKIRELIHHWKINDEKLSVIKNLRKQGFSRARAETHFEEILRLRNS